LAQSATMLGSLGSPDLLVLFLIALIIFAPGTLPEFDKSFGEAIKGLEEGSMALGRLLLMPQLHRGQRETTKSRDLARRRPKAIEKR